MSNKNIKIRINPCSENGIKHTILVDTTPTELKHLSYTQQNEVVSMLNKVLSCVKEELHELYMTNRSIDSSTGNIIQADEILKVYTNKRVTPYGGGLAVVAARNVEEAHAMLIKGLDERRMEYLIEDYLIDKWIETSSLKSIVEPRFIGEGSYSD